MLVYRDGAVARDSAELRGDLLGRLERQRASEPAGSDRRADWLALLLRAGELEAGVEDAKAPTAETARAFTDACAEAWWCGASCDARRWAERLGALPLPPTLRVTRPEGFAYYALDPESYARATDGLDVSSRPIVVVGIRSIGTTLSAVVRASAAARGARAVRFTVRPSGHPWDRKTELPAELSQWLTRHGGAACWVVDEGPGMSGSTFLSAGEALAAAGASLDRIMFFTSHAADPERLVARGARERWARFRSLVVPGREPFAGAEDLGGGQWRRHVYGSPTEWPACWTTMERRKYREPGSLDVLKFIGFPPHDEPARARAAVLADAGFCPAFAPSVPGYAKLRWCDGAVLQRAPSAPEHRARLLDYLAFRSAECAAADADVAALESMVEVNVREALGREAPRGFHLELERPVYADARLMVHEWVQPPSGPLVKVDATDHGDDHLLPGPTDSAWDVAGAIWEWGLSGADASELARAYQRRTGDDVARRLAAYSVAYAAQRVGYFHMAALSAGGDERARLDRALERWTKRLAESIDRFEQSQHRGR